MQNMEKPTAIILLVILLALLATRQIEGFTVSGIVGNTSAVILIQCIVNGTTPNLNVKWFRGDRGVEFNSRVDSRNQTVNSTATSFLLRIQNFTYLDAGEYACLVRLPSMEVRHTMNVVLPTILRIAGARNITAYTSDINVVLSCEALGYDQPDVNIQWLKGGLALGTEPSKHNVTVIYENGTRDEVPKRVATLTISEPSVSDSGLYYCKLNGTYSYASVLVQILATPTDVTIPSLMEYPTESTSITTPSPTATTSSPDGPPSILRQFFWVIIGAVVGCLFLVVGLAVLVACVVCVRAKKNTNKDVPSETCSHEYDEVGPAMFPARKDIDAIMIEHCVAYNCIGVGTNVAYSTNSAAVDNLPQHNVA